jgi:hypothetical protein
MVNINFPGVAPIVDGLAGYRNWVGSKSRGVRMVVFLATLVVMGAVGLAVPTLQATIGVLLTQVLTWAVLLAALYTWYALARSLRSSPAGSRGGS